MDNETWNKKLLPKCIDCHEYEIIKEFWSCFGRRPKDYLRDMQVQWGGKVENGQNVWVDPQEKFTPRFSVRKIAGWKKGVFIHRWNNMASVWYNDGSHETVSCGGDLFSRNSDLINAGENHPPQKEKEERV